MKRSIVKPEYQTQVPIPMILSNLNQYKPGIWGGGIGADIKMLYTSINPDSWVNESSVGPLQSGLDFTEPSSRL